MIELKKTKTILFDGDGVLWKGDMPIPGIAELFSTLDEKEINWALLTNNNTRTAQDYVDKLNKFGVTADLSRVFTSSTATAAYLLERYGRGAAVHAVGMSGLLVTLEEAGFKVSTGETMPEHEVVAVVSGMDRQINHEKIKVAMRLILGGADFIATNTDGSFVTPEGVNPGTGMVIGALHYASGTAPLVIGKPEKAIFETALKRFKAAPKDSLMVGDRLNTDILGAQRLGIPTAAVLTGVSSWEEIPASEIQPNVIYADIGAHL